MSAQEEGPTSHKIGRASPLLQPRTGTDRVRFPAPRGRGRRARLSTGAGGATRGGAPAIFVCALYIFRRSPCSSGRVRVESDFDLLNRIVVPFVGAYFGCGVGNGLCVVHYPETELRSKRRFRLRRKIMFMRLSGNHFPTAGEIGHAALPAQVHGPPPQPRQRRAAAAPSASRLTA